MYASRAWFNTSDISQFSPTKMPGAGRALSIHKLICNYICIKFK
nr:MAG TPA_asm: hypothetical protein [Caudoviricetes sp.]